MSDGSLDRSMTPEEYHRLWGYLFSATPPTWVLYEATPEGAKPFQMGWDRALTDEERDAWTAHLGEVHGIPVTLTRAALAE